MRASNNFSKKSKIQPKGKIAFPKEKGSFMKEKTHTQKICNEEHPNCEDCSVNGKLMCNFNVKDTIYFIVPVLSVWITWILGLTYGFFSGKINLLLIIVFLVGYIGYLIFFFQFWENKILCSHCPYYAFEEDKHVKCYANYGIYKVWKYNPAPMSSSEKIQFIISITLFAIIPLIPLVITELYIYFSISLVLSLIWIISMHFLGCSKCPNFSCPLNSVSKEVVDEYLKQNSVMRKAWEDQGYIID